MKIYFFNTYTKCDIRINFFYIFILFNFFICICFLITFYEWNKMSKKIEIIKRELKKYGGLKDHTQTFDNLQKNILMEP